METTTVLVERATVLVGMGVEWARRDDGSGGGDSDRGWWGPGLLCDWINGFWVGTFHLEC